MSRSRQWSLTPGGGATWGAITGTLSNQTDLQGALDGKAPTASPTFTGTAGLTQYTTDHAIVAVNQGLKQFSIAGDQAAIFNPNGGLSISGSTGNNGLYNIASVVFNAPNTVITVAEVIPSAVADGSILDHLGTAVAKDGTVEYAATTAFGPVKWRLSVDSGGNFLATQDSGSGFQTADVAIRAGSGNVSVPADIILGGMLFDGDGLTPKIRDSVLYLSDITTGDSSTVRHGLLPKLSGVSTQFLNGAGAWATPASGGATQYAARAYLSANGSIPISTPAKAQLNVESYDTHNFYDNATNFRFQPTVAGYYELRFSVFSTDLASGEGLFLWFYKNGTALSNSRLRQGNGTGDTTAVHADVVFFNGTTDYVELFWQVNAAANRVALSGTEFTHFTALGVK